MCHNTDCHCIGADEAYFSSVILALENDDIENANTILSLLLEPNLIVKFLEMAKVFSTAIKVLKKSNLNTQNPIHICAQIH